MKNNQLKSIKTLENDRQTLAEQTTSYPAAAQVLSHAGTDAAYTLVIDLFDIAGTDAANQWDQIVNEGYARDYSTLPYVRVKFNRDLPSTSSWTLHNSVGTLVSEDSILDSGVREIKIHLGMLPNGQPSLTGQSNFNLQLSDPTPGSFNDHEIDTTGGGLVIIANVEGCEQYIDPLGRIASARSEPGKVNPGDLMV